MPLLLIDERGLAALLVLAEFGCLTVLGFLMVQCMHWETGLANNRTLWLSSLREGAGHLRTVRRQLDQWDGEWPSMPMMPALKTKWAVASWVFKAISIVSRVRS